MHLRYGICNAAGQRAMCLEAPGHELFPWTASAQGNRCYERSKAWLKAEMPKEQASTHMDCHAQSTVGNRVTVRCPWR